MLGPGTCLVARLLRLDVEKSLESEGNLRRERTPSIPCATNVGTACGRTGSSAAATMLDGTSDQDPAGSLSNWAVPVRRSAE
jgi:hypothetical protein